MAEIQFLEAKRALADAHAQALRSQFMLNQSVIIENGLNSEGGSEPGSDDDKVGVIINQNTLLNYKLINPN